MGWYLMRNVSRFLWYNFQPQKNHNCSQARMYIQFLNLRE